MGSYLQCQLSTGVNFRRLSAPSTKQFKPAFGRLSMALIYPTIWEQGDRREQLTPGYHYKKHVESLVVPEHQVVTIYKHEDRQGQKSMPLYGGTYHHLYFYGIGDHPGLIHVEDCGLTALDLVEIGWNSEYAPGEKYPMYYSLPTGDHKGGEGFPNDKIQWLYLPLE